MRGISHQHTSGSKVVGRALHRYHGLGWQQKVIVLQLSPSGKTTNTLLVGPQETRRSSHAMSKLRKMATGTVSVGMQNPSLFTRLFVLGKTWKPENLFH